VLLTTYPLISSGTSN